MPPEQVQHRFRSLCVLQADFELPDITEDGTQTGWHAARPDQHGPREIEKVSLSVRVGGYLCSDQRACGSIAAPVPPGGKIANVRGPVRPAVASWRAVVAGRDFQACRSRCAKPVQRLATTLRKLLQSHFQQPKLPRRYASRPSTILAKYPYYSRSVYNKPTSPMSGVKNMAEFNSKKIAIKIQNISLRRSSHRATFRPRHRPAAPHLGNRNTTLLSEVEPFSALFDLRRLCPYPLPAARGRRTCLGHFSAGRLVSIDPAGGGCRRKQRNCRRRIGVQEGFHDHKTSEKRFK